MQVHSKKEERLLWKDFKLMLAARAPVQLADQLEKLGTLCCENGRYKQAAYIYQEALAYSTAAKNPAAIRKALRLLAEENRDAGNYDQAGRFYTRLISMDKQEHKPLDTILDTNFLGMNAYLAGCSAHSRLESKRYFDQAEADYKIAMLLAESVFPPPRDMKLLIINSYAQLLIEEQRLVELRKFCANLSTNQENKACAGKDI